MLYLDLELHAVDEARNTRRAYRVRVTRDLFGLVVVEFRWGRVGTVGTRLCMSAPTVEAAQALVRQRLRRRTSAPRRIGVGYALVRAVTDGGPATAWLPSIAPLAA